MTGTNEQRARELLPCPFCGGEPKLRYIGNDRTPERKLEIKCSGCRMQLTHAARTHGFNWLEDLILRDWNRRAALAEPKAGAVHAVLQIGNVGALYDPQGARRAFTYSEQPGNIDASNLGYATNKAALASAGDSIDRGLALLQALQEKGFGVFEIDPQAKPGASDLWCLHILGPDDVHPAPSKAHAELAAKRMNEWWAAREDRHPYDPKMEAVAAVWPHSPESHAAGVGEFIGQWLSPPQPAEQQGQAVYVHRDCIERMVSAAKGEAHDAPCFISLEAVSEEFKGGMLKFYAHPQPAAVDAVRVDDAAVLRAMDAYSAARARFIGNGEYYPEGMRAALEAALPAQGREGEVG